MFRTLSAATGPHLRRLPDGETGIRKTWIRFLQGVLADNPAIELAHDVPPFKFTQWDGKLLREIPRLRLSNPASDSIQRPSKPAMPRWRSRPGSCLTACKVPSVIPAGVKFQLSLPTPIAPTYNNMLPR